MYIYVYIYIHIYIYIYIYTYTYVSLDVYMGTQTGIALWRMLLEHKFALLELWCTYLEKAFQKSITKVTIP
jgi:hypothetical protein